MVIYTSGTTSEPKGVQHTHNTLLSEIRSLGKPLDATGQPASYLSPFPSGHMGGVLGLGRAFLSGSTTVLMDAWDAARCAALIQKHAITSLASTPFFLQTLIDEMNRTGTSLPTLDDIQIGGAGVAPSLVVAADEQGWRAFRCYGSTEHPTVTGILDAPVELRGYTDGPPFGSSEVRLVDDEGHDVATGEDGEVVTLGPELFVGYTNPRLDADAFLPGGWFRTGDIGRFDDQGCLTIVDRKKDIIIRGGENISSKEVEDVLVRHPAIVEAAVVATPDHLYGERVCAFVVLRPGTIVTLEELGDHFMRSGVAKQKTPERLEIVDDLPRTAAGKVKKPELRARLS
jgi:acyl-CoA synthetase (AMP-forming)/AMP-acid ligase II